MAGTNNNEEFVFTGDKPKRGAVQVASNKKIDVVSVEKDDAGKSVTHHAKQSIGQFIVIPPSQYDLILIQVQTYLLWSKAFELMKAKGIDMKSFNDCILEAAKQMQAPAQTPQR